MNAISDRARRAMHVQREKLPAPPPRERLLDFRLFRF